MDFIDIKNYLKDKYPQITIAWQFDYPKYLYANNIKINCDEITNVNMLIKMLKLN